MASNFGATVLDVVSGMEGAKAIQRRDEAHQMGLEDRQRAIKRDNLAMEQAQFGLESARSNQAHVEKNRPGEQRLKELQLETAEAEADFARRMRPGAEKMAGEQQKSQLEQAQLSAMGRMWEMFRLNPKAGIEAYNKSNILDPGMEVTGYATSPDGSRIVFKGKDGQPIHGTEFEIAGMDKLVARLRPGKLMEVEPGKRLVDVRDGTAKEIYAAPDKPMQDTFAPIPENSPGLMNRRTGAVTPIPTVGGPGLGSGTKLDQRVTKAVQAIVQHFGGQFDAMGQMSLKEGTQDQVLRARVVAEQKVKGGMDPQSAAKEAIEAVSRDATLSGIKGPGTAFNPKAFIDQTLKPNQEIL